MSALAKLLQTVKFGAPSDGDGARAVNRRGRTSGSGPPVRSSSAPIADGPLRPQPRRVQIKKMPPPRLALPIAVDATALVTCSLPGAALARTQQLSDERTL